MMMMMIDVFNLMFFECSTIDMVWLTYKVEHILQRVEPSDPLKTCHYIMDWFANNMDILRGCNVNICWHKVTLGYHKVSDLHQGNRWPSLGCKRFAAGVSPFSDTPIASRLVFFLLAPSTLDQSWHRRRAPTNTSPNRCRSGLGVLWG